jgi:hypothetical protein
MTTPEYYMQNPQEGSIGRAMGYAHGENARDFVNALLPDVGLFERFGLTPREFWESVNSPAFREVRMPRGQGKKLAAREVDKAIGTVGLDVYDPKAGNKLTPLINWRARLPRRQY